MDTMREPRYIIKCQPTESIDIYFFAGFSDTGKALFSKELGDVKRYLSITDAEREAKLLYADRTVIRYIIYQEFILWN